ncbi:MAG TPA: purine-binding chemotaxis protein CheW [Bacteroidetes bacterium]|nr:purine-binding chemotaxis protein CheW [Bacteroidota bacterium]HEX05190.1 purine-binding chemotaxis protein CheW [Bacteroidota bacterium]
MLAEGAEDTLGNRYLTFNLENEEYGVEIRYVTEIVGIQPITELPDTPPFMRGVINLRGKVIPVIEVRARFSLPTREYDDRTCIIVVNIRSTSVGLIVDRVAEVMEISDEQIEDPPNVEMGASSQFISGLGRVEETVKILLDLDVLLFQDNVMAGAIESALEE